MLSRVVNEKDCRVLYADILRGSSRHKNLFVRHYTELDLCKTEVLRLRFHEDGLTEGLLTEKDKLALLHEKGHWTNDEEKAYQTAKEDIEQLYYSLKSLVVPQQIAHLKGTIAQKEAEFSDKFASRIALLGITVEQYAARRASEGHILGSFYRDENCTTTYFSAEDIDELNTSEVRIFMDIYHEVHAVFSERNLKKVAVCPFFLNGYSMSDENPHTFFGKPIAHLTLYQAALFAKGRYYKSILSEPDTKGPPEEYYEDLDKVILHYDRLYSIILGKRTNNQLMR